MIVGSELLKIEREQMLLNSHIHKLNIKDQKLASKNLKYKQARIYHKLSMFKQARKAYMLSIEIDSFFRDCSSILLSFIFCNLFTKKFKKCFCNFSDLCYSNDCVRKPIRYHWNIVNRPNATII